MYCSSGGQLSKGQDLWTHVHVRSLHWQVKQGSSVARTSFPISASVQMLRGCAHTGQQESGLLNIILFLGQSTRRGHCFL